MFGCIPINIAQCHKDIANTTKYGKVQICGCLQIR